VEIVPDSPILAAHPQLSEKQVLRRADYAGFVEVASHYAQGPIDPSAIDTNARSLLQAHSPRLDSRLDRVSQQQLLVFGVARRDVAYELCGMKGRLVLSGAELTGGRTREAIEPIRRRLWAWGVLSGAFAIGSLVALGSMRGSTAYFQRSNSALTWFVLVGIALAVVIFGALTRALRVGFRLRPLRTHEHVVAGCLAAALIGAVIVKLASAPTTKEARDAIERGDVGRARLVREALASTGASSNELAALEDEIALKEAASLEGDTKLAKLDDVADHRGPKSTDAAREARKERLTALQSAVKDKNAIRALALLEKWKARLDPKDNEVAIVRAGAHDLEYTSCEDDPCRWTAARKAASAETGESRADRVTKMRDALLAAMSFSDQPGEATLARLQRLRKVQSLATRVAALADGDGDLTKKSATTIELAESERSKIPLIGSDKTIVAELLGSPDSISDKTPHATVSGVAVYWSIDANGRCTGVYVTGATKETRALTDSRKGTAAKVLAQAVGHPAIIRERPDAPPGSTAAPTSATWMDGYVPITARWQYTTLYELRIGDATP